MNFVKVLISSDVGGDNNPWVSGVSPHQTIGETHALLSDTLHP